MINIPSKWGFCDDVFIVPIKVQDAFFTAVMDAPEEWSNSLVVSGFKKTNEGWIKRGLADEHALAYLSDQVAIRDVDDAFFDSYFNPPQDSELENLAIPSEIAEAIQWLSLQGRRGLFFELSISCPALTDVMLSGYLEAALAGVSNADTNVVYEFAIERIKSLSDDPLSESVIQFAKEKNINLVVQSDDVLTPRGSVLLPRGEHVAWFDNGVERQGRVSRPLRVGDDGCWLHSLPIAWVGGYPSPNEMWVSAKALGLTIEPSAADTVKNDADYLEAVSFLGSLENSAVADLANRIYQALTPTITGSHIYRHSWVANGKLWGHENIVNSAKSNHRVIELDGLICPISDEDRVLIKKLSDALDVMSKQEYGSDSVERTTLCFGGVPGVDGVPLLQYSLTALFPVDKPSMFNSTVRAVRLDGDVKASSVLDSFKAYQVAMAENTNAVRTYSPVIEEVGGDSSLVISGEILIRALNSVIDHVYGVEIFRDRVIELGLEKGFSTEFVYRLLSFEERSITAQLKGVTPIGADSVLAYPVPSLYHQGDDSPYKTESYHGRNYNRGIKAWRYSTKSPLLVKDAISRIVRDDLETGLPKSYYGLSGPSFGHGNAELDAIVKKAGIGRLYDFEDNFHFGLIKTDVIFKPGVDHIADEILKFDEVFKSLGSFDLKKEGTSTNVPMDIEVENAPARQFSQEAYDSWLKYSKSFVDAMRISLVPNKIIAYDQEALKNIINGEITRQWGVFLSKTGFDETGLNDIRESVLKSVKSAVAGGAVRDAHFSNALLDGMIFRITKTARKVSWRHFQVNSLNIQNEVSDWRTEPRGAMLDHAYIENFGTKRGGPRLVIDLLSIADPELAGRLYNIGSELDQSIKHPEKIGDETGYQDTGVVTGFAIKDLRAMNIDSLLAATGSMSSTQREKYVKKDLYFPRPVMADLKEKGCCPAVAAFLDQAWVMLPSKPYSMITSDVEFYGRLLSATKDAVNAFLDHESNMLKNDNNAAFLEIYEDEMEKSGVKDLVRGQDWDRRSFYRKGTVFKGLSYFTSFGIRDGYDKRTLALTGPSFNSRFFIKKGGEILKPGGLAWEHLLPKKAKAPTSAGIKKSINPDIRTGEDYRKGKILDSEDFIKTFGFSGVEFGNWTNQAEREAHINLSYDSMLDFSKVLECEPMALSLGGRLGLCFGSRGRGGKDPASAHYEPTNMAINLTRRSGAGSLAHEYFHAIAGHYGEIESGIKGADYSEKVGNMLSSFNALLSPTPLLRKDMQEAFFDLMKAIMYKPVIGNEDSTDISAYTQRSHMYESSADLDRENESGEKYWSLPHELFARSMEVWVGVELAKKNARNDYLVSAGKLLLENKLYPDAEHIKRISHFAEKWVGALRTELSQVQHPYLGAVEIPVFHSKNKVRQPLNQYALESFVQQEMNQLFGKVKPRVAFSNDDASSSAGTYDFIKNLMVLNLKSANRDTFYHEAWHACHSTMLSQDEQQFLLSTFTDEAVKAFVIEVMTEHNYSEEAVNDAQNNPLELQAYAFELWVAGKISLSDSRAEQVFGDVKEISDAAANISNTFPLKDVEALFERFYGGELAMEKDQHISNSAEYADELGVFGGVMHAPLPEVKQRGMSM